MNHLSEEQLILHYYGEPGETGEPVETGETGGAQGCFDIFLVAQHL